MSAKNYFKASLELILFTLGLLRGGLDKMEQLAAKGLKTSETTQYRRKQIIKKVIADGFALSKLVEDTETMFGGMLTNMYSVYALFSCCGLFFGTGVLNLLVGLEVHPNKILFSMAQIVTGILSLAIMYSFLKVGQDLAGRYHNLRMKLQDLAIEEAEAMGTKQRAQVFHHSTL